MPNRKPKIIGGICEFCGVPAYTCDHYRGRVDSQGVILKDITPIENKIIAEVGPPPVILDRPGFTKNCKKLADIIIPHHTNNRDLAILLENIDLSIFNVIVCAGQSFGVNCNKGARLAETDKLIFINDDVELKNWQLIKILNNIGPYDFISSTQIAGLQKINKYWGIGLFTKGDKIIHSISFEEKYSLFPSGFFFGIKRKHWEKLGGFNEQFRTGNEDVDFGLRALKLKLKTRIFDLEIRHKECQSKGRFDYINQNEELIYSLWSQAKLRSVFNKFYL